MRGPLTRPSSMARLSPKVGPLRSRTLVKPRISMSAATLPASRLRYPISAVISTGIGAAAVVRCTCASIRPGIRVRPPPSMVRVSARRSTGIGLVDILSILLPRTSTLDGADSVSPVPSKMRTFSNSTAEGRIACACTPAAARHPMTRSDFASLRAMSDMVGVRGWNRARGSSRGSRLN